LKGRDNKELAARIDDILAQIGEGKTAYFSEEEIRKLGDHCVLPLTRFIQSDRSLGPERQQRRIEAARILADLAQTCSIPDLINLLADKDREVRFYAAQALVRLTRETPGGLTPNKWRDAPAEQRELALKAWQTWWGNRKKSYPCPRDDG
jgi:HEAT repeat protein